MKDEKEIIALSALLAFKLTEGLSVEQLVDLKLFINQLNCDVSTIYTVKIAKNKEK